MQQTYEHEHNMSQDISIKRMIKEVIIFQNKTVEQLIKDAPKSIDKCFRKMQNSGWYGYEEYLLKYYKDIASREGKKLILKLNNGKTKNFISRREIGQKYDYENNANNAQFFFSGYNKHFDCFIVQSHLYQEGGGTSFISKANGNDLLGLYTYINSAFSFSPEATKVVSASVGEGNKVNLVIYRGEKEIVVRENVDITPKLNDALMISLLDWVDENTFKVGFNSMGSGSGDKIYTYHFRNGSWHLE